MTANQDVFDQWWASVSGEARNGDDEPAGDHEPAGHPDGAGGPDTRGLEIWGIPAQAQPRDRRAGPHADTTLEW